MIKRAALIVFVGVTPVVAQQPMMLACEGVFSPDTTHERVVKTFGAENVQVETIDTTEEGEESSTAEITVVYPHDSGLRLEISWKNPLRHPATITVAADSRKAPGWSVLGLVHGDDLAKVEALNGHAFMVRGFGYDGMVTDWKGGRLATDLGKGCQASVRFLATVPGAPEAVMGDGEAVSDDSSMRAAKPVVNEFGIKYD